MLNHVKYIIIVMMTVDQPCIEGGKPTTNPMTAYHHKLAHEKPLRWWEPRYQGWTSSLGSLDSCLFS